MNNFRKKNILYVITKSNFGGAQRNVFELATHLPKNEYDVLVAFGGTGLLKQKLEKADIRTYTINSFERDVSLFKDVRAFFELYTLIRSLRPDIVHLHSSKAGGIGAFAARLCGVPRVVFTAHGWPFLEDRNSVWKSLVWFLSWFTALLVHSVILVSAHDHKNTLMPWVKKKCTIIHTGIDEVEFLEREEARHFLFSEKEMARHKDAFFLVTTAELTKNKNLLTAIQSVAEYNETAKKRIFYTIIGDGELRTSLTTYLTSHNLTDSVKLQGYVDDARIYLKAFDIFLLPSLKEGMPYALLEAGLAGLPTIASHVGGIPEVITSTVEGILVDPKDTYAITSAVRTLVLNTELRNTYAQSFHHTIHARFSFTTMIEKTRTLYVS